MVMSGIYTTHLDGVTEYYKAGISSEMYKTSSAKKEKL